MIFKQTLNKGAGFIAEWLILLSCFGYPLQAMIILVSKADRFSINLAFRSVYLLLALSLLTVSLPAFFAFLRFIRKGFSVSLLKQTLISNSLVFLFLLFWLVYGIRLIYELEYQDWRIQHYSDIYVYSWAFGCSMIPALAILIHSSALNMKRFVTNMLIVLFLANLCISFCLWHYSQNGLIGILGRRAEVSMHSTTGNPDLALINPITVGLFGEWLSLAALTFMFFYRKDVSAWISVFLLSAFMLGTFNLVAGASRGPLLDYVLIMIAFILIGLVRLIFGIKNKHFRTLVSSDEMTIDQNRTLSPGRRTGFQSAHLIWIIFIIVIIGIGIWKIKTLDSNDLAIVTRLKEMFSEGQEGMGLSRLVIWKRAWYQFTVNPVFGDSIINDCGYFYSHNIIMDALMSVGIVGFIPFLIYILSPFYYFIRLPRQKKREVSVLFVVFIAAFLLSMTSGGLWSVPEVWILSAAVIGISKSHAKNSYSASTGFQK